MSAADGNGAGVYGTKLRKSAGDWSEACVSAAESRGGSEESDYCSY